jgi:ABC-type Fe3+ transport system permease subunit
MEGLAASVVLIAIVLGVLLAVGGLVYLVAQRLPKRSSEPVTMRPRPRRQPANRWIGIGWIILVLLIIGLWTGINSASASNPQPQPAVQLTCPPGPMWTPLQNLCQPL